MSRFLLDLGRDLIATAIEEVLGKHLGSAPFEVGRLAVGNIDYVTVVSQAVEKKLAAKWLHDEEQAQRVIALGDQGIEPHERVDSWWPERTAARSRPIAQLRASA